MCLLPVFTNAEDRQFVFLLLLSPSLSSIIRVFQVLTELFSWLPYERPGSGD